MLGGLKSFGLWWNFFLFRSGNVSHVFIFIYNSVHIFVYVFDLKSKHVVLYICYLT